MEISHQDILAILLHFFNDKRIFADDNTDNNDNAIQNRNENESFASQTNDMSMKQLLLVENDVNTPNDAKLDISE